MFSSIYKKLVCDFPKFTFFNFRCFSIFNISRKNFNLDASSDALILEGDKD